MPTKCEGPGNGQPCLASKPGKGDSAPRPAVPSYAPPGERKARRCRMCLPENGGWVNVVSRMCEGRPLECKPCTRGKQGRAAVPSFAPPGGGKATRCRACAADGWVNVRSLKCEGRGGGEPCPGTGAPGSPPAVASYGPVGEKRPRRCGKCKLPGWVNRRQHKCEGRPEEGSKCTGGRDGNPSKPSFAAPGTTTARRCAHCKLDEWFNVRRKVCQGADGKPCRNGRNNTACWPSYAAPGSATATRCSSCAGDGWQYAVPAVCEGREDQPCTSGEKGGPSTWPTYARSGARTPSRCERCRGEEWVLVRGPRPPAAAGRPAGGGRGRQGTTAPSLESSSSSSAAAAAAAAASSALSSSSSSSSSLAAAAAATAAAAAAAAAAASPLPVEPVTVGGLAAPISIGTGLAPGAVVQPPPVQVHMQHVQHVQHVQPVQPVQIVQQHVQQPHIQLSQHKFPHVVVMAGSGGVVDGMVGDSIPSGTLAVPGATSCDASGKRGRPSSSKDDAGEGDDKRMRTV